MPCEEEEAEGNIHSKEEFITHFKDTYSDPYPPAWMLSEILPLGVITNIYSNIKNKKIKKRISQSFNLQIAPFESWMTIVTLTRNLCCHHARIWNKQNTLRPMMPNIIVGAWINPRIHSESILTCASSSTSSISYLPEMTCGTRCRLSSQNIPKLTSAHWASHQATGRKNHCGAHDDEDWDCRKKEKMGWFVPTSSILIE